MKLLNVLGAAVVIVLWSAPATAQNLGVLGVSVEPPPGWLIFMHPDGATVSIVQDSLDADRQEPEAPRIRVYSGQGPNLTNSSLWRVSGDPFETQIAGIGAAVITVDAGTQRRRIVTLTAPGGHAYQFHLEAPIRLWDAAAPTLERALMNARFYAPPPVPSSASTTTLPVISMSAGQRPAGQPTASAAPSSFPVVATPPSTGAPVPSPPAVTAPVTIAPARLPAACDISAQWQMNTANVGSSTWTFTRRPDGYYAGQEQGQGSATGVAVVVGSDLRLDWNTGAGGWAGYVTLALNPSCSAGNGRHVFERGRGGFENTSWQRVGTKY